MRMKTKGLKSGQKEWSRNQDKALLSSCDLCFRSNSKFERKAIIRNCWILNTGTASTSGNLWSHVKYLEWGLLFVCNGQTLNCWVSLEGRSTKWFLWNDICYFSEKQTKTKMKVFFSCHVINGCKKIERIIVNKSNNPRCK